MKRTLLLLVACNPGVRPYEVAIPPAPSAPVVMASATPAPAASSTSECSREIVVVDLEPETPTCTVYGLPVGARGLLEGPCHGNGMALARFGVETTFTGRVSSGKYELEHQFSQPIGDGCEWRFTQKLAGTDRRLTLTYEEEITKSGPKCYRPCGAVGDVEVR